MDAVEECDDRMVTLHATSGYRSLREEQTYSCRRIKQKTPEFRFSFTFSFFLQRLDVKNNSVQANREPLRLVAEEDSIEKRPKLL